MSEDPKRSVREQCSTYKDGVYAAPFKRDVSNRYQDIPPTLKSVAVLASTWNFYVAGKLQNSLNEKIVSNRLKTLGQRKPP